MTAHLHRQNEVAYALRTRDFLVSELKYAFPYTFRTARARVSRNLKFTKKPYLPLFSSETADKFAKDYAIKKSFRHALHLVTAHLQRQNQVAHALRTRDFWLASLSMHFPIHFGRRAHEYPVTLRLRILVRALCEMYYNIMYREMHT